MRTYGVLQPTALVPKVPDTTLTFLIAGSSGQAADWPAGTNIARLTGRSTAGASLNFEVCMESTKAAAPSSGLSTLASSAQSPVMGQGTFQLSPGSTGFSVAALSSGYITAECWHI